MYLDLCEHKGKTNQEDAQQCFLDNATGFCGSSQLTKSFNCAKHITESFASIQSVFSNQSDLCVQVSSRVHTNLSLITYKIYPGNEPSFFKSLEIIPVVKGSGNYLALRGDTLHLH